MIVPQFKNINNTILILTRVVLEIIQISSELLNKKIL